ncbi:hypothetical protein [Rhizobium leguminosarum]|nr:hypothetical protein [Rhizobium leguminosarum]
MTFHLRAELPGYLAEKQTQDALSRHIAADIILVVGAVLAIVVVGLAV